MTCRGAAAAAGRGLLEGENADVPVARAARGGVVVVSVGALVGRLLFPLAGAQRHGAQLAEQKQGSPRAFRESEFAEMVTDSHLFWYGKYFAPH